MAQECRRTWGLTFSVETHAGGVLLDHPEDADPGEPPATGVEEDRLGVAPAPPLLRLEQRPALAGEPVRQGSAGQAAERDDALLVALAEDAEQRQVGGLDRAGHVAEVQADDLADPGPGAVEHLEEGPVAQDKGTRADDRAEQPVRLLLAQRLGQQVGDRDGRQVEGGVVPPQALFDQEPVEAPHARERPGDGRRTVGRGAARPGAPPRRRTSPRRCRGLPRLSW